MDGILLVYHGIPKGSRDATYCIYKSAVLILVGCFVDNNDDFSKNDRPGDDGTLRSV